MDLCQQSDVCFLIHSLGWSQLFFQGASVLISWLQSLSAGILEPKKIKSVTFSIFSPSICLEMIGLDAMIFIFWMLRFFVVVCFFECWFLSQLFHSRVLPSPRGSWVPLHFLPLEWYHLHTWGCWYFSQQSGFQLVEPCCAFAILNLSNFSTSGSNCCFLNCIQVFQETGQMVWHSHL